MVSVVPLHSANFRVFSAGDIPYVASQQPKLLTELIKNVLLSDKEEGFQLRWLQDVCSYPINTKLLKPIEKSLSSLQKEKGVTSPLLVKLNAASQIIQFNKELESNLKKDTKFRWLKTLFVNKEIKKLERIKERLSELGGIMHPQFKKSIMLARNIIRRFEQLEQSLNNKDSQVSKLFVMTRLQFFDMAACIEVECVGAPQTESSKYFSKKNRKLTYPLAYSLEYYKDIQAVVLISSERIGEGGFKKGRAAALLKLDNYTQPLESVTRFVSKNIINGRVPDLKKKTYLEKEAQVHLSLQACNTIIKLYATRSYSKTVTFSSKDLSIPKDLRGKKVTVFKQAFIFERGEKELFNHLRKARPSFEEQLRIAYDIGSAIFFLHERGIAHRDLKTENILLKGSGAKLIDFGWATTAASILHYGTSELNPPELCDEGFDCTMLPTADPKKADIWAFGSILYEMLFPQTPPWYYAARDRKDLTNYVVWIQNNRLKIQKSIETEPTAQTCYGALICSMLNSPKKRISIGKFLQELTQIGHIYQASLMPNLAHEMRQLTLSKSSENASPIQLQNVVLVS